VCARSCLLCPSQRVVQQYLIEIKEKDFSFAFYVLVKILETWALKNESVDCVFWK